MLAVRRPSVTELTGSLQSQGLISYKRGRVAVMVRAGLEAAACECYGVIQREFESLPD